VYQPFFISLIGLLSSTAQAVAAPPELAIDPTGRPNPVVLKSTTPEISRSAFKMGILDCKGDVSEEPAALVDIPKGSNDISITLQGLDLLVVMTDTGLAWCANSAPYRPSTIRPGNWPGGKARIFVGPYERLNSDPKQYEFTLVVSDVTRAIDLGWADAPKTVLDGKPAKPVAVSTTVETFRDYGIPLHNCSGQTSAQPSHIFEIERPLGDVSLIVTTADEKTRAVLLGPLTTDMRNVECQCLGRGLTVIRGEQPLKPGRYALLGTHAEGKTGAAFTLVIADGKTKSDPFWFTDVPDGLPVDQRSITAFLPFWGAENDDDGADFAPRVQALFTTAPKGLFVFAKQDLDDVVLSMDIALREGATPGFPKKGEPLLLYTHARNRVFAADGSTYGVRAAADLFAPSPEGPIALPAEPRNTEYAFSLEHTDQEGNVMMQRKPPNRDDPAHKPFTAYLKVVKDYDGCMLKVWRPVEKKVAALRNTKHRTAAEEQTLRELEKEYNAKEEKSCKPNKLQTARKAYYAAMVSVDQQRRNKALQSVNKRLRQLFAGP
jgi:hypothetical protein